MEVKFMNGSVKVADSHKRTIDAVFSTKEVDRDGEVVMPNAFEKHLKSYLQNPVLLFCHNRWTAPVGKIIGNSLTMTRDNFSGRVQFADTKMGRELFTLFRDGMLNAFSVGFMPKVVSQEPVVIGQTGRTILEAELVEVSVVPIPANRSALQKTVSDVNHEAREAAAISLYGMDKDLAEVMEGDDGSGMVLKGFVGDGDDGTEPLVVPLPKEIAEYAMKEKKEDDTAGKSEGENADQDNDLPDQIEALNVRLADAQSTIDSLVKEIRTLTEAKTEDSEEDKEDGAMKGVTLNITLPDGADAGKSVKEVLRALRDEEPEEKPKEEAIDPEAEFAEGMKANNMDRILAGLKQIVAMVVAESFQAEAAATERQEVDEAASEDGEDDGKAKKKFPPKKKKKDEEEVEEDVDENAMEVDDVEGSGRAKKKPFVKKKKVAAKKEVEEVDGEEEEEEEEDDESASITPEMLDEAIKNVRSALDETTFDSEEQKAEMEEALEDLESLYSDLSEEEEGEEEEEEEEEED